MVEQDKRTWEFPVVLRARFSKDSVRRLGEEAKRRGTTVSALIRGFVDQGLGATVGQATAEVKPAIPDEMRRIVLEHFESRLKDIKSRIHGGGITEARYREMAWDDLVSGLNQAQFKERHAWLAAVASVRAEEAEK